MKRLRDLLPFADRLPETPSMFPQHYGENPEDSAPSPPEDELEAAYDHLVRAEEKFPDDSKAESVANNARRWTEKSVQIVNRLDDE